MFHTDRVFHPGGISLAYHTLAPLYGALAIPLEPVFGLIATYNLFVLATIVTSALAMFLLARSLTGSAGAAFVAGFLFAFSPYHQVHAPHLNLLSLQFLPLVTIAAHAFLRTASWWPGLMLAALGALSFYACHEYALFAALLAVLFAGALAVTAFAPFGWYPVAFLSLAAGTSSPSRPASPPARSDSGLSPLHRRRLVPLSRAE